MAKKANKNTVSSTVRPMTKQELGEQIIKEAQNLAYARSKNLAVLENLVVKYDATPYENQND